MPRKTFWSDFRQFFMRGLGVLLPSVLTLALLWWAYGFLRSSVAEPINGAVREVLRVGLPAVLPPERLPDSLTVTDTQLAEARAERSRRGAERIDDDSLRALEQSRHFAEWWQARWYLQAIGFVVALVVVYLAGLLLGNYLGRRLWTAIERLLTSLPVLKQVYPSVKQVVEFLLGGGESAMHTGRVVLIEFPRPGMWMIGLMTGEALRPPSLERLDELVTVFVPTSPTPFAGFAVTARRSEVVELEMTFEEAIRYVVSGGVLVPERLRTRSGAAGQAHLSRPAGGPKMVPAARDDGSIPPGGPGVQGGSR